MWRNEEGIVEFYPGQTHGNDWRSWEMGCHLCSASGCMSLQTHIVVGSANKHSYQYKKRQHYTCVIATLYSTDERLFWTCIQSAESRVNCRFPSTMHIGAVLCVVLCYLLFVTVRDITLCKVYWLPLEILLPKHRSHASCSQPFRLLTSKEWREAILEELRALLLMFIKSRGLKCPIIGSVTYSFHSSNSSTSASSNGMHWQASIEALMNMS